MDMLDHVIRLFRTLPEWVQLAAFLVLVAAAIVQGVITVLSWREKKDLKKQLARTQQELEATKEDRKNLEDRFKALDRIDAYVWTKPDATGLNRFVPAADRKTRFIALFNLKGGVGKTTLTLNLGAGLAQRGKSVLLVDLDFQGTLSNMALDQVQLTDHRKKGRCSDAIFRRTGYSGTIGTLLFPITELPGCQVMVAREELEVVEYDQQSRFFLDDKNDPRFLLQRHLHSPEVLHEFDYVLFDCPPRMTTACINALACADFVLVPTSLSHLDIEAVPRTLKWLADVHAVTRAQFLGAVVTRGRMRAAKLIKNEMKQLGGLDARIKKHHPTGSFVFESIIPESPEIHHLATGQRIAAVHSEDARAWFGSVAKELERKVRA